MLASSGYGGGTGTETDPYLISTPEHLNQLQLDVNVNGIDTTGKYYQLTKDINLSGYDNDSDESNGNFTPIGYRNSSYDFSYFEGVFIGNGYKVSNVEIALDDQYSVGFFSGLYHGVIQDFGLENVVIKGVTSQRVGGLVGNQIGGTISQSYVTGSVSGSEIVGGLVGRQTANSVIKNSYSKVDVVGYDVIGGLIGEQDMGVVEQCYAIGGIYDYIGASDLYIGGLIGEQTEYYPEEQINTNSYWDTQATGVNTSVAGTGLTTAQMTGENAKTNMTGFDFDTIWKTTDSYPKLQWEKDVVEVKYGGGLGTETDPYLISTPEHLNQLQLDVNVNGISTSGKYYQLTNDIDLLNYDNDSDDSNGNFIPIGNSTNSFKGVFDGNDQVVSNLKMILPEQNYVGLFGHISSATIRDVGVENVVVEGREYVGGLLGYQEGGLVEITYTTGTVRGYRNYIGGLIGYQSSGTINQSYVEGDIRGPWYVGGLVGRQANGTISQSYATGYVIASGVDSYVGGLVGYQNKGVISQSYAAGRVIGSRSDIGGLVGYQYSSYSPIVENSYWDIEASEQSSSQGGTGLTNEQMTKRKVKENMSGFDFENIWKISNGYPLLHWQTPDPIMSDEVDVLVNGIIEETILSLTIPTSSINFTLNPNQEAGQQFIASGFELTNEGYAPLTLEIKSFEQVTDVLNDVEPTKYSDWNGLNKTESKDIAIALVPKVGEGWLSLNEGNRWVANLGETSIGTIKGNSTVSFGFEAKHGSSFTETLTPKYQLSFIFGLQK